MKKLKSFYYTPILLLFLAALTLSSCFSDSPPESAMSFSLTAEKEEDKQPESPMNETYPAQSEMKVHFIDVGQGDCTLIETDGHYMLIDAGENDQAETVIGYLKQLGITRLEYVIGTHPHSDHIGGLDKVIDTFDIKTVIMPPKEHTTKSYRDVLTSIAKKNLTITAPVVGDIYELGDSQFQILAPNDDYGDNLNNWSVGIRLVFGNTSFILCGDAEVDAEHDMIAGGLTLRADVLKLGHHGSHTSSINKFLDQVRPKYAVIECGSDNPYGYPHKETMHKMEKRNISVYRTDTQGTIIASTDGSEITWKTEK